MTPDSAVAMSNDEITVAVSIDTEEDNWGEHPMDAATVENIGLLPRLQDLFEKWGARATYVINRPPLLDAESIEVLGALAARDDVEIGAHCHPWNTPPLHDEGGPRSMMFRHTVEENRAKIAEIRRCLLAELGVRPETFRTGRWGFGSTVAHAVLEEGFTIDSSVSPFIDWSATDAGPDYSTAPHRPYRFDPGAPLVPKPDGALLQLPTTVGFLKSGDQRAWARRWFGIRRSPLGRFKAIGLLERSGLLQKRWLSPETASGDDLVRLTDAWVASGERFVQLTFHSCTLLPGATPFVGDREAQERFFAAIETFLRHCSASGYRFRTLAEAAVVFDPAG